MSIKTRLTKLEEKLLPNKPNKPRVIICEEGETKEQACKRLGIDREDGECKITIFVVFD